MSTLIISLIQSDLVWEGREANIEMFDRKIRSITNTQLVILPEMFSTGFSMAPERLAETMDGTTVSWMKKIAAEKRIIVAGSVIIEEEGHYFNRLVWMLPNGQSGYYDKKHLFAFAEEDKHYTAGNKRFIASVNGWKVNLNVCYDLRFPVWSRQSPASDGFEYDLLVYVANWPEKRSIAWKTLLQARAIENQCYVVGVNRVGDDGKGIHYSGDSRIVGPLGDILCEKTGAEDIFTITLDKKEPEAVREKFPFHRDVDEFMLIYPSSGSAP